MSKKLLFATLVISVIFASSPLMAADSFTVAGSGACQELVRGLAGDFMKANPGVNIDVPDSIGSGGGVKSAGEGKVALGRVARGIKDKEKVYGLSYLAFAKSPVVFAAHSGVPSLNISAVQSRDIFQGNVQNWKELGGPDMKLRVITRHEGEASLEAIRKSLHEWQGWTLTDHSKQGTTDQETTKFIGIYDGAVGFLPLAEAIRGGLTVLSFDGKKPTDPDYPLVGEFGYVYMPENMTGVVKKFVDFTFTPEGAEVVSKYHALPLK